MLRVRDLSKSFGDLRALRRISFDIEEPGIYLFIGPNGSGKSTLLKIIAGVLAPDEGEVSILRREKTFIGYMPQEDSVYQDLTVMQNIRFFSALNPHDGKRIAEELLSGLKLDEKRDVLASELSGGMRRALSLACTVAASPDIFILDEPTTGFDYALMEQFWNLLNAAKKNGRVVLISSHSPSTLQHADMTFVLKEGRIVGWISGEEGRRIKSIEEAVERVAKGEGMA